MLVAQAYSPLLDGNQQAVRRHVTAAQQKCPASLAPRLSPESRLSSRRSSALNEKSPLAEMACPIYAWRSTQILAGTYDTPLGPISFKASPDGEIIQTQLYVAQMKMDEDGKNGKLVYVG